MIREIIGMFLLITPVMAIISAEIFKQEIRSKKRGKTMDTDKDKNNEVISRDDLYKEIERIFGNIDKFLDIVEEDRPCCYISFKDEDEYVVIDSRAHRYISWYKHVGRDFDTDMETKEEVILFLERLYINWRKEYEEEGKV